MKNSSIEWTTHTFNPWIGCSKVSPGCAHCYAETLNKRMAWTQWGDAGERFRTSPHNWNEPRRWHREATKSGQRARVFCASLADWLDPRAPVAWLAELLSLVKETPNLDWLFLTKRPQLWRDRMAAVVGMHMSDGPAAVDQCSGAALAAAWLNGAAPLNVWIGTSVEDQDRADERIPHLLDIPARIRFLSCEPLLGPLDLSDYTDPIDGGYVGRSFIDWIIVGGESGPKARPMEADWVRSLREECEVNGAAFFFKQWGGVRKKEAGRILDGETFDQLPTVAEESNNPVSGAAKPRSL